MKEDIKIALCAILEESIIDFFDFLEGMDYNVTSSSKVLSPDISAAAEFIRLIANSKDFPKNKISKKSYISYLYTSSEYTLTNMAKRLTPKTFRFFYTRMMYEGYHQGAMELEEIYHNNMDKVFSCESKEKIIDYYYKNFVESCKMLFVNSSLRTLMEQKLLDLLENNAIKDLLTERIFADTFKNVSANIDSLNSFKENFADIISIERKTKLKMLFTYISKAENCSTGEELNKFAKNFLNIQPTMQETLYDMIRYAKLASARNIKNSCSTLDDYRSEIKDGVKLVYADKKPFKFVISTTHYHRAKEENTLEFDLNGSRDFDFQSCSAVSNDALYTFGDITDVVSVGFNSFNPKLLQLITTRDNYTEYYHDDYFVAKIPNAFLTFDQLLKRSKELETYNELNFLNFSRPDVIKDKLGESTFNKIPKFEPDFIVALKEPTEYEMEIAKNLDIPIFVLNEQKYTPTKMRSEPSWQFDKTL